MIQPGITALTRIACGPRSRASARVSPITADFAVDEHGFRWALESEIETFSWHRFVAVQIWIFTSFFVYVTATEIGDLMGEGQLLRLLFRHRSSEHRLTRRQHVRAWMELSRLAETTPRDDLLDPATPQGQRLIAIVDALRQVHVPEGRTAPPG